ncbi:hypothetical protein GFY24_33350 [Nocardia sp. SYP-A9097]|uniref:effector-associated constant component EACC1 n=1 Tax=Nocardia sp. SYP-A9097 TaxID=2663237 RepID=UPI00129BF206|nr:hypothetical protein [Nocardia sp. SYP-A9097]MRH92265.1 hypothetical protein [Nocardia sp. SYP-A9097]
MTIGIRVRDLGEFGALLKTQTSSDQHVLENHLITSTPSAALDYPDTLMGVPDAVPFVELIAATGSALMVAIKTLPDFVRSRRTDVTVTIKLSPEGSKDVVITAANADDAVRVIELALAAEHNPSAADSTTDEPRPR